MIDTEADFDRLSGMTVTSGGLSCVPVTRTTGTGPAISCSTSISSWNGSAALVEAHSSEWPRQLSSSMG